MLRSILSLILFTLPAISYGQNQQASARAAAGCGPAEVQFNVKTDKNQHTLVKPQADKAMVYVIQDEKRDTSEAFHIGAITTRVGVDGKWVGANHGFSYLYFTLDPGEHRLCTDWQSSFKRLSKLGSALTFTSEAGKVYYFRIEVEQRPDHPATVKLEPIDNARGEFLVASHALSTPRVKEVASE
jgi:hypothetical protein